MQQTLLNFLERYQLNNKNTLLIIGYSGGLDSSVMLHTLAQLQGSLHAQLLAVYIDHGLQAESKAWASHCEAKCSAYNMPFQTIRINAQAAQGQSPEQAARAGRYHAFETLFAQQDIASVLLTAHHQDDQAETLLLQLMRGAGPAGLSAMPAIKALGQGRQGRPLLSKSRAELEEYAQQYQLSYIQDPSNLEDNYDRNYLRNRVMPLLQQRWPSANTTVARSAALLAEQQILLNAELQAALQKNTQEGVFAPAEKLAASKLSALLRLWLQEQGAATPSQGVLAQIQKLLDARQDAKGEVTWGEFDDSVIIRSYGGRLYCCDTQLEKQRASLTPEKYSVWNTTSSLVIKELELELNEDLLQQQNIRLPEATVYVDIKFNQPNSTRVYQVGHQHSKSLKNAFQEAKVPHWLRAYCPLLYVDDKLRGIIIISCS